MSHSLVPIHPSVYIKYKFPSITLFLLCYLAFPLQGFSFLKCKFYDGGGKLKMMLLPVIFRFLF